ncbi:DUF2065 domain-containing protein [Parashewanella spongiae]|uniref:DUF2065 domain-containing protein n=1 Tax=Parashewanella spongiae TaxID=342950 RepID=A0A3A6TVR4_9GAMM|nr:DUF2065 domain-containing protein [Parashewanella spongiae]MCL1077454.1 DUF2065 domain-containing protein [Parashewanella spongiae]RJY18407.1 DUF2065 domain-containing protein [Parashewanella spongiae]
MTFTVIMLALGLMLIFEGFGPLLIPKRWKKVLASFSEQSPQAMQRLGGCLVTAGLVLLVIFS